jgi:TRAP-type transport system periplasmic protein
MKKSLSFLLILLCLLAFTSNAFSASEKLMRIGWATPENHSYGLFAKRFKELVEKYTDGSVKIKLFHSGQLGSEDSAFKALQLGSVDGYIITMSNLGPHYPLMNVFTLPYVFESMQHMQKVLKSEVVKDFFADFQNKTRVAILTYGVIDTRDLYNTKKDINNFNDFAGLKYRVPKNEVMIATFKAFGAEPVPMAWADTPTAIQTGTVDGGDNGTTVIRQMKFYEMAKHLTVLDHFLTFSPLLVSDRFLKKLNPEEKSALYQAAAEANEYIDEYSISELEKTRKFLEEKGMTVTRPDRTLFIEAAQKVQEEFADKKGAEFKNALEKIRAIKP